MIKVEDSLIEEGRRRTPAAFHSYSRRRGNLSLWRPSTVGCMSWSTTSDLRMDRLFKSSKTTCLVDLVDGDGDSKFECLSHIRIGIGIGARQNFDFDWGAGFLQYESTSESDDIQIIFGVG